MVFLGYFVGNIQGESQKSELEKVWPNDFKFQSTFYLVIHSNSRQETVSMPKYSLKWPNWTIISGIYLMQ